MSEINWQNEALNFLLALSPVKRTNDVKAIRRETTELLCKHAHCLHTSLVGVEDEVTARVLYSTLPDAGGFVDVGWIEKVLAANDVAIDAGPGAKWLRGSQIVVLPIRERSFNGAMVMAYPEDMELTRECRDFLYAVWIGVRDITMLAQVYFSAEKLTTRFNAILGTVPESIVFVDDTGKQGWVNSRAAELLGLATGDVPASELAVAMHRLISAAVNYEDINKRAATLFSRPGQYIKEWKWIYGSPADKVLEVACVPAVSDNIKGRLWVFDDITSLYRASEQLKILNTELEDKRRIADEQNLAKSEFLANMSHEIRTPMNGVIGMTSLLEGTALTEEQKDYVGTIRISGETLLSIINDILDFSKIESRKMELEQAPFSISKVIEETYDLLSVKAYEKGLDLLYYIDAGVPVEVIGDVTRFRQIMVNLVSNGLKFTEQGEVLISARVLNVVDSRYTLEFKVQDTGIGIPADKYHRLFESFSQVDSSTTRKYGGTGLGLAICQRIIKLMGGDISVESEEGKGSCFIFSVVLEANTQATQYRVKPGIDISRLAGKSVLLLDDNRTNLRILKEHLAQWQMEVAVYDNYNEAVSALLQTHFDLAIIDMIMPEKNGMEVGEMVRGLKPQLPLILYSSALHLSMQERVRANQIFSSVLNKPFKQEIVKEALLDVFGRSVPEYRTAVLPKLNESAAPALRILVAEDDSINQKLIGRVLEKLGYSYDMVDNGARAVEKVRQHKYDVVFMDVMMPEVDGVEATATIRSEVAKDSQPVIIALTANALAGDREYLISSGMDDFVSKPYKTEDIQKVINKWILKSEIDE
ncbi:MAG TPA: response regulator [Flavipsychrobacter sp.]